MDQRGVILVILFAVFILYIRDQNTYKVKSFSVPALAEPIRFLLSYGNLVFEDQRIQLGEWERLKPFTPYGKEPILEYKGKVAHHSLAICRYLGKKLKLVGENDWDDLEIDAAADTISDLRLEIDQYFYEPDSKIRAQKKEILVKEILPLYIQRLENQIRENKGFLAIGKLTWADLYYAGLYEYLHYMLGFDFTENAPKLRHLKQQVYALPAIKAWIEKRPKNNF
ncbi:unnamed protein product [Psylliodes chrysocephalus]|uniref:glutathione transferase n=1 Tax=Psylliodes chrysocephalus TaxID=3402493 RepID=A0A9P0G5E1_9CUCU|nr:unnamed protein product [Psylliodes chrysocephala]